MNAEKAPLAKSLTLKDVLKGEFQVPSIVSLIFNPYCPNFEFFHKNLRFGIFLSVDNYFTFKNSKKYVLMVPGPKY